MRSDVIDIIKAISIIMIVNVHLLCGQVFTIGCTYHVIAFFFATGLVHGLNDKWKNCTLIEFGKRKVSSLLYPYITLSICYILMHLILNLVRGDNVFNEIIADSLIKTLSLRGIGTLWFLPVLFVAEMLFFLLRKKKAVIPIVLGLSAIIVASQLYAIGFFQYNELTAKVILTKYPPLIMLASIIATMFICLGYIVCKLMPKLFVNTIALEHKQMIFVVSVCICSLFVDYSLVSSYSGDLHKLSIGNILVYLVCSISGIAFVTSLSIILLRYSSRISKVLKYWGKNSLIIMTTHTEYYVNSIAYYSIVGVAGVIHVTIGNYMTSLFSLALIMLMESLIIWVINITPLRHIYKIPSCNRRLP